MTDHRPDWAVLEDEALRERVHRVVIRVADRLSEPAHVTSAREWSSVRQGVPMGDLRSLASGYLSLVILFAELHRGDPGAGWLDVAARYLRLASDEAARVPVTTPGLFVGSAAYVYVLATLRECGLGSLDGLDRAATATAMQTGTLLRRQPPLPARNLITGGLGVAVALRAAAAAGSQSAAQHLAGIVDGIQYSRPDECATEAGDLSGVGMSEGIPALLALLGTATHPTPAERSSTEQMEAELRRAWSMPSSYQGGWCLGRPGTAFVLLSSGPSDDVRDSQLLDVFSCRAEPLPSSLGLCHGVAGLLSMATRLYNRRGQQSLALFARRCVEELLLAADQTLPYVFVDRRGPTRLHDPGLLMGTTGIVLALLSATVAVEPRWDRCMLLSP